MSRVASGVFVLLFVTGELFSATVSGTVSFLAKRGQRIIPAETLVWLNPAGSHKARKAESTVLTTRGKTLVPHVTAIPVGSSVQFPNEDPISHNLFSVSSSNPFDLGLYRRDAGRIHQFHRTGMVNVYCNVHPNMSAVIHVMPTPYYAFSDATGLFTIRDVPPGKYKLVAWNEQTGTVERDIHVSGDAVANLNLTLDGRTFRAAPHMTKDGKPYQSSRPKDY